MVHCFNLHGKNIVVDVNSGSVHVVDLPAYGIVCHIKEGGSIDSAVQCLNSQFDEIQLVEASEEIKSLITDGLLFSKDTFEHINVWKQKSSVTIAEDCNAGISYFPAQKSGAGTGIVKALCLHVAHDCNLDCSYCFAGSGNFGMQRALMKPDTAYAAIDFVIANSGNRKNIEIDFFGGEPLLSFETIQKAISYARKREKDTGKIFRFTLTTNAVLLDEEKLSYINKNMSNLVLSIDGRKEVNDRMRKTCDGSGSYDLILDNIIKAAHSRNQQDYYVRGTFTSHNTDFSEDVKHLAALGFRQISVEPVVAPENTGFELKEEHLKTLFAQYEKLALDYVECAKNGNGYNFFHFMLDLDGGPCVYKRVKGCGAGFEYLAVTPEGDLYPCHQFVGTEGFLLGNVFEGIKYLNIVEEFKTSDIFTKEECRACWARFYCSGGCAANAWHFSKDIKRPYNLACLLQKKRVECALWIKAAESDF